MTITDEMYKQLLDKVMAATFRDGMLKLAVAATEAKDRAPEEKFEAVLVRKIVAKDKA